MRPGKKLWLVAILALLLSGCGQRPAYRKVSLVPVEAAAPTATSAAPENAPLRVAIAAVISPRSTMQSYQPMLDYLEEKTGRPVELVQRRTYAEINDLLRTRQVDLAFVCTGAYVRGQQEFGMELLVAPQVNGQTVYYSYIIVPADSPAQSLADLRGRVFAFTDPLSNTGRLAPLYLLWQMGETPEHFFQKAIFTYSHDNSIKAVAEKWVDGAAVDSLVYDFTAQHEPDYIQQTRIVARSEPYGIPPVVVHPELDADLKQQLRDILLGLDGDEGGREALAELGIERFVTVGDSLYDSARRVLDTVGQGP
ncbi:MAG TPA: phosphate/phosphite/phosphonate ABC transporter substrate-binding protein [Anaerolineae bacterium]|nr:phosphate/phosphite/phosphonate ABC transporter substrate-binding protein [Anaerolineae bacterium]